MKRARLFVHPLRGPRRVGGPALSRSTALTAGERVEGFTLIELLVVITIIVVLMGILMPVVIGLNTRGHDVKCQDQLRQFGMALIDYEADHGRYPGSSGRGFLADLFRRGAVEDARLFVCPLSDEAQAEGWELRCAKALGGKPGDPVPEGATSYWGRIGGAKSITAARRKRIPGSQIPVACDGLTRDPAGDWTAPHRGRVHVLYLDGHVEAVPIAEFTATAWEHLGEHPRQVLGPN